MRAVTMTVLMVLAVAGLAGAAPEPDVAVQRVEAELATVARQRDELLQDLRMAQELRTIELSPPAAPAAVVLSAPMINYDDMVRDAADRRVRIERFNAELSRLYDESLALADQDRQLRAELRELLALHRQ